MYAWNLGVNAASSLRFIVLRRPSSRHPPQSATAASSRAFASSSSLPAHAAAASLSDDCKLPPAAPAAAASSSSSTSRSLADGSCVGLDYSSSGQMTWSLLADGRASSSSLSAGGLVPLSFGVSSDLCGVVDASVPLPAPGSTQENELIQQLAEAAVEREQKQQDREHDWRTQLQHALADSAAESTSDATSLRLRPTSVDELRFPEPASADDRNGVTSPSESANAKTHNK